MFTLRYSQILGGRYFADGENGKNVPYIVKKVQEVIEEVERWALMTS